MSVIHRINQLRQLNTTEWWVLVVSMVLLPLIALALHSKGYQWTRSRLSRMIPGDPNIPASTEGQLKIAQSISRMVSVAANHGPYHANCLKKSLLAWWLLARSGLHADLIIGVNKDDGELNAHAWLEYEGNILIDADHVRDRFAAFESSPSFKDY